MMQLSELKNTTKKTRNVQRVGRGPSSGRGKTSSRGHKGSGSRSGYRRRLTYEGGQGRLFKKLPTRGFTRGRFLIPHLTLNLSQIEKHFEDGEVVSLQTLIKKGLASKNLKGGVKILSQGELKKKVTIEAQKFSKEAIKKLEKNKIPFKILKKLEEK